MLKKEKNIIFQLEQIALNFQLTGQLVAFQPISIGHIHKTYQLMIQENGHVQSYILQQINTHVFRKPATIMENIEKAAIHLKQKDYPKKILKPVATHDHLPFYKNEKEQYWRVFPFFENTLTVNAVNDSALAYEVAFTFGEYSRYLHDLSPQEFHETIPDFHNSPLRYSFFKKSLEKAIPNRLIQARECIEDIQALRPILNFYPVLEKEKRVVHYDTKINNVLLDKQSLKSVCVIDLDTLMPGMLPYDFGDMVRTIAPPVDENEADLSQVFVRTSILEALINGFLDGLQDAINSIEKENLYNGASLIIYEQAIRFLTDYLLGDQYYPVKYETQNLARAKNQMTLLKDFLAKTKK